MTRLMPKHSCRTLIAVCVFLVAGVSSARDVAWPDEPVSIHVQDQPLRRFLQDFFAAIGEPVLISDGVRGDISGHFDAPPEKIFADIVRAYGLVPYYDGTAMHVAVSSELRSETLNVAPRQIDALVRSVVSRDLVDENQSIEVQSKSGTVQVRGAPQFVEDVRALVRTLKPAAVPAVRTVEPEPPAPQAMVFRTFELRFASAADVVFMQNNREVVIPGIATLLRNMVGDGQSPRSVGRIYNNPAGATVPGLRGRGLRRYNTALTDDGEADDDAVLVHSPTSRVSRVRIEAEPNLNAVIIRDYADAMPLYEGLVERLDVEPNLIEIKVAIIDVDKNKLHDLGVNWRYDSDDTSALFGGGEVLQQDGGLVLNTVLGDARKFFLNVNALAQSGSARVVSRPQIVTVSNLEAVLANDQTFFVRVAGNEEVDLFDVSVGTSLRVLPNVVGDADDPKIRLLVTIEDGSIDSQATVDEIPVIERSSLTTQAIVFDGESLLIGGLVREDTRTTESKVPVLGNVPAVGRLFRRDTHINIHSERLFLISPRVITASRQRAVRKSGAALSSAVERGRASQSPRVPAATATTSTGVYLDGF